MGLLPAIGNTKAEQLAKDTNHHEIGTSETTIPNGTSINNLHPIRHDDNSLDELKLTR